MLIFFHKKRNSDQITVDFAGHEMACTMMVTRQENNLIQDLLNLNQNVIMCSVISTGTVRKWLLEKVDFGAYNLDNCNQSIFHW